MTDWAHCLVGNLCDSGLVELQTGPFGTQLHAHDYVTLGIPVVPTEAIYERQINHSVLPMISIEKAAELERHKLKPSDILFARRGVQATGHIGYVRDNEAGFVCGTGAIRFRVAENNPTICSEFLSHVFANPASIQWLKFHAIGATMPNLNEGIIRAFPLSFPPLVEQKAIALLLSAFDDKIELNRRMNETLEAMARTIFKDWFVEFGPTLAKMESRAPYLAPKLWTLFPDRLDDEGRPEGWDWGTLRDVASSVVQVVDPGAMDRDTPYIGLEHMPRRSIALNSWEGAGKVTSAKLSFSRGDFLFGKLRPYFHKVGVAPIDGICSTDIVVLRGVTAYYSAFVISCISTDEFVAFTEQGSDGTKMPRTSWELMSKFSLVIPTSQVAEHFQGLVSPLLERILANIGESRVLAQTRDLLLPKLMSGEIRVSEAETLAKQAAHG